MSYRVRIYDSRIHALSLPGGMVYKWQAKLSREVAALARLTAPIAKEDWGPGHIPGHLRASHKESHGSNALGCFGVVTNTAKYARWVHEGTYGPIKARGNYQVFGVAYMVFWINGKRYEKETVNGQRSQPWLAAAQLVVLQAHGIG